MVHWKAHKLHACEDGKARTVYIRGEFAPFVGWIATPDSAFSVAAYVRIAGKRCTGYVDENATFRPFDRNAHMMGIRISHDASRFNRRGRFGVWRRDTYTRGDDGGRRELDIRPLQCHGAQIVIKSFGAGWFQVATWLPNYRQERNNMRRAEMLALLRRWRAEIPPLKIYA